MGKYDKIIKESLSKLIIPFSKRLGIYIENMEIIKDKLQYTIEREPDFLVKIKHDESYKDFILQLDFQVLNDAKMPSRMLLYRNLIDLILNLKTKQFVVYLGDESLTMPHVIQEEHLYFEFNLIDIRQFSAQSFLNSDIPEEVLLSVLANFEGESPDIIIEKALIRLKKLTKRHDKFKKYAFQLHIFTGLRKLQGIFQQKIKAMPLIFNLDITQDPIYLDGLEEGREQGIEQGVELKNTLMVEKFLRESDLSVERIADFVGVSIPFVKNIQARLKLEKKL